MTKQANLPKNLDNLVDTICALYERHCSMRTRVIRKGLHKERGIKIHKVWAHHTKAPVFIKWGLNSGFTLDKKLDLDRINNDGHYYPNNCRWTTRTINSRNTIRSVMVNFRGKEIHAKTLSETKYCIVDYPNLSYRLKAGWPLEEALSLPLGKQSKASRKRRKNTRNVRYTFKGKLYNMATLSELKLCKISGGLLHWRLKRGWSVNDAMYKKAGPHQQVVTYKGRKRNLHELIKNKICKVSASTFRSRLNRGWPLKKALLMPAKGS
jgi:hypothetical protein